MKTAVRYIFTPRLSCFDCIGAAIIVSLFNSLGWWSIPAILSWLVISAVIEVRLGTNRRAA